MSANVIFKSTNAAEYLVCCKLMRSANTDQLSSKKPPTASMRGRLRVFTIHWNTIWGGGHTAGLTSLNPNALVHTSFPLPMLQTHTHTLGSAPLSHWGWILISWYDSRCVRDLSISMQWASRRQVWCHAGIHSHNSVLAEQTGKNQHFVISPEWECVYLQQ